MRIRIRSWGLAAMAVPLRLERDFLSRSGVLRESRCSLVGATGEFTSVKTPERGRLGSPLASPPQAIGLVAREVKYRIGGVMSTRGQSVVSGQWSVASGPMGVKKVGPREVFTGRGPHVEGSVSRILFPFGRRPFIWERPCGRPRATYPEPVPRLFLTACAASYWDAGLTLCEV